MGQDDRADLVVVGAGTVGGWASGFAAEDGAERSSSWSSGLAGQGRRARAAGVVRAQGGTPTTVALGRFSIDFYRSQHARYGTDSGFRELGYLILAVTDATSAPGTRASRCSTRRSRRPMGRRERGCPLNPTLAAERSSRRQLLRDGTAPSTRRATCAPTRSRCSQPGVQLRERTPFSGCGPNGRARRAPRSPASRRPTARSRPSACS